MNITSYLTADYIKIGTNAKNRADLLYEIAQLAKKSPLLSKHSIDEVYTALLARENIGSTGFENGIAIPHCMFEDVTDFVVGLITIPQGIDFNSYDKEPTFVFFFIIGPTAKRNRHIFLLSSISKLLRTPDAASDIAGFSTPDDILQFVLSRLEPKDELISQKEKCMFQVLVQKEEYFEEILKIFASAVPDSVTVLETNNAGHYLHHLPLFSAFWSDESRIETKLIIGIIERSFCNDIIRRINMITSEEVDQTGVLITVQDLLFTSGAIEF